MYQLSFVNYPIYSFTYQTIPFNYSTLELPFSFDHHQAELMSGVNWHSMPISHQSEVPFYLPQTKSNNSVVQPVIRIIRDNKTHINEIDLTGVDVLVLENEFNQSLDQLDLKNVKVL